MSSVHMRVLLVCLEQTEEIVMISEGLEFFDESKRKVKFHCSTAQISMSTWASGQHVALEEDY